MYRDSCEWENFASLFAKNAYVYTTWSGRLPYQVRSRLSSTVPHLVSRVSYLVISLFYDISIYDDVSLRTNQQACGNHPTDITP